MLLWEAPCSNSYLFTSLHIIYLEYPLRPIWNFWNFSSSQQIHPLPPQHPKFGVFYTGHGSRTCFWVGIWGQKETSKSLRRVLWSWKTTREKDFMVKILSDSKIMTRGPAANLCHDLGIVTKNLWSSSKFLKKIYSTVIECDIIFTFPYFIIHIYVL